MSQGRDPLKPFSPPHQDARIRSKMKQAKKAYVDADYHQARKLWEEVLDVDPKYTQAWTNSSAAYWCLKDYENALVYAEEGIKTDDSYPTAHLRKGLACIYLNRLHEACESLELALSIDPENQEALRSYELASRLSGVHSLGDRQKCLLGGALAIRIGDGNWEHTYSEVTLQGMTYQKHSHDEKAVLIGFDSISQVSTGVVRKSRFLIRSGGWYEFQAQSEAGASHWVETICHLINEKKKKLETPSQEIALDQENVQPAERELDEIQPLQPKKGTGRRILEGVSQTKHARSFISPGASEHTDTEIMPAKHVSFASQRNIGPPIASLLKSHQEIPQALKGCMSPTSDSPVMTPTLFRESAVQSFPECSSCDTNATRYCRVCQRFFCDACNKFAHQRQLSSHLSHQIKLSALVGLEKLLSPTERDVLNYQLNLPKASQSQNNLRGENASENVNPRNTQNVIRTKKAGFGGALGKKGTKGRRLSLSDLVGEVEPFRMPLAEIQQKPGHRRLAPLTVDPSLYHGRQGRGTIVPIGKT